MEKKDRIDLVHQKKQGLGTIRVPRLYAQEDIRIPEKHKIPVVKKYNKEQKQMNFQYEELPIWYVSSDIAHFNSVGGQL